MRADLRPEAILQRRDDPAPVGVVLGVGRREQDEIEGQGDLVAAHLDVALLEHVEQAHLDALGQVGELVDGEDAAVGAGHEAVVERELVGEVPALGHLDRVDLADEVGDRRVRGGQLLAVALGAVDPLDGRVVAVLEQQLAGVAGHGRVGVVVDLGAGDDRHPLVEQRGEGADHAGLRLPALAEEDHVVAGEERVLQLRAAPCPRSPARPGTADRRTGSGRWRCAAAPPSRAPRSTPTRGAGRRWRERGAPSWCPSGQPIVALPPACPARRPRYPRTTMDLTGTWRAAVADDDLRRARGRTTASMTAGGSRSPSPATGGASPPSPRSMARSSTDRPSRPSRPSPVAARGSPSTGPSTKGTCGSTVGTWATPRATSHRTPSR